jgi:alpha-L-rhamnosidase
VFTPESALAWVLQHPVGGTGRNPWEAPCSTSTPALELWGNPAAAPAPTPLGSFASSSAPLDTVFNFSAYTMLATAQDVNVDGQTRERDVDIVDSLINARGQYALFSPGDYSIAERTLLEAFSNDTGMWSQWYDFKASAAIYARDHALHTGDTALLRGLYCSTPRCIAVPPGGLFNSLQFEAGLEYYFNATGSGLLAFPRDGTCKGSWSCEVLLDWPVGTRDGYDASADNSEDTARSALGAMAAGALADAAGWVVGADSGDARAYASTAQGLKDALVRHNLRYFPGENATAWFVDGRVGKSAPQHAAVHSTLFACSAGACDGLNASVAGALTSYLVAHGVPPSSCMMGRWWVEALYRLGVSVPQAADAALGVLTSPSYPGWLDMLHQGATTTMEAWRPADKGNLDFAHPWCASPAFTIIEGTLGAAPTSPAWRTWRLHPQPSSLTALSASIPTPGGMLAVAYAGAFDASRANATVSLQVAAGAAVEVCLPMAGPAGQPAPRSEQLLVDGEALAAPATKGRLLCTTLSAQGAHTVTRLSSF